MRKPLMTPQEIQRTMDFILRSNADSVIRMERLEEDFNAWNEEVKETLREVKQALREAAADIRATAKATRAHEKRMRALEASDRRTRGRVQGIKDLMRLFSKRADVHAGRIDRLEKNSP